MCFFNMKVNYETFQDPNTLQVERRTKQNLRGSKKSWQLW